MSGASWLAARRRLWLVASFTGLLAVGCHAPWRSLPAVLPGQVEGLANPEPIVFMPADDLSPVVARDGSKVVFVSDQNGNLDIWVKDSESNSTYPATVATADDFDPTLSIDGRLAYVSRRSDAKGDIYIAGDVHGAKGDGGERLTDGRTRDRQPVFSFDGRKIFFTSALGVAAETIMEMDLDSNSTRRVSPTPGFDPAPSPDGRYLIYTAPPDIDHHSNHLVALRLSDGSTRSLSRDDTPEGFARFSPIIKEDGRYSLFYVRFPDDDNADGQLDGNDRASLWRLDIALDALWRHSLTFSDSIGRSIPLTDGSTDELFPFVAPPFVYFTSGREQQDIVRLPLEGLFPEYADPKRYFELAVVVPDSRTRFFALRALLARAPPDSELAARALLAIGNLHLETGRSDLARRTFSELAAFPAGEGQSPRVVMRVLAEIELLSLLRAEPLSSQATTFARASLLDTSDARLLQIDNEYAWSRRVRARVALERAELILERKGRAPAIEALEYVITQYPEESFSAARAMMRRTELLTVTHDLGALAEAYSRVITRFPDQAEIVQSAAAQLVETQLSDLEQEHDWGSKVDLLRRLAGRYLGTPVCLEARWRLSELLWEKGLFDEASIELEQLVRELGSNKLERARALEALAEVYEQGKNYERALATLSSLRTVAGDLPGFLARARERIVKISLDSARESEEKGNLAAAREAYRSVIDSDFTQVKAYRRYLALSAQLGALDEVLARARELARRSERSPMARYVYGLALAWQNPPDLDEALEEVEKAIELNPRLTPAYLTLGWIREMQDLQEPGAMLSKAVESYKTALRLNDESLDRETEAEASLNLGNALYRLSEQTSDASNMRAAFERYVDVYKLDFRFPEPTMELVYWERFGRSAAWAKEFAISVMATKRAIVLARALGREDRLRQLQGNLALAYIQAGELESAKAALEEGKERLDVSGAIAKLVLARREAARAELAGDRAEGAAALERVLEELRSARTHIQRIEESGIREAKFWEALEADNTRAQFGFSRVHELNLNLALAQAAHEGLGDMSRSDAIAAHRSVVLQEAIEDPEETLLVVVFKRREPLVRNMLRERLGLLFRGARQQREAGDWQAGMAQLEAAEKELAKLAADDAFAKSKRAFTADVGRVLALRAEWMAQSGDAREFTDSQESPEHAGAASGLNRAALLDQEIQEKLRELEALSRNSEVEVTETDTANAANAVNAANADMAVVGSRASAPPAFFVEFRDALPLSLGSTTAIATTASVAFGPTPFADEEKDVVMVRARLLHARGLLALARAHATPKSGSVEGMLRSLDQDLEFVRSARAHFEAAAREASLVAYGLGARILALALHGAGYTSSLLHDRSPAAMIALAQTAKDVARRHGEETLRLAFEMTDALRAVPMSSLRDRDPDPESEPESDSGEDLGALMERLRNERPELLAAVLPSFRGLVSRAASSALKQGDISQAFVMIDHLMMIEAQGLRPIERADPTNGDVARVSREWVRRHRALVDARQALSLVDAKTPERERLKRIEDVANASAQYRRSLTLPISGPAQLRLSAEPQDPEFIAAELAPQEAILMPAEIDGLIHLFVVDGSTLAETRLHVVRGTPSAEVVRADVSQLRAELAQGANNASVQDLVTRLRGTLFDPIHALLAGKKRVFVCSGLIGGPIPQRVAPEDGPALVHLSTPSLLEHARQRLLVGVEGTSVLSAGQGSDDADGSSSNWQGEQLLPNVFIAFRKEGEVFDGTGEESRSLDARSLREKLRDRAKDTFIVDASVRLEPFALERSVVSVGTPGGAPGQANRSKSDPVRLAWEADAFAQEVPLSALPLPAKKLILTRVEDVSPGALGAKVPPAAMLNMDSVLIERGFATTIVIPASVPRAAVIRLVNDFQGLAEALGPAEALRRAIENERSLTPASDLIFLLGSAGLDAQATKAFAKNELKTARNISRSIYELRNEVPVSRIKRWIRLQLETSSDEAELSKSYRLLVRLLSRDLTHPRPDRAVDEQRNYLAHLIALDEKGAPEAKAGDRKRRIANGMVRLGELAVLAKDFELAESTFQQAIEMVKAAGTKYGPGSAYYEYSVLKLELQDFEAAAKLMEMSIASYERAGAYRAKVIPADASAVARRLGVVYLESLSDPARAKAAFTRALAHTRDEVQRIDLLLNLAHVARRSGAFDEALRRAAEARSGAKAKKDKSLELASVIEAANIAWYQGDYRRGQELCEESLGIADERLNVLREHARKVRLATEEARRLERPIRKRKIFALSVCGLVSMSQRSYANAESYLSRALASAERLEDEREIANQLNNLGRAYLEFGRNQEAIRSFEQALAIDERRNDRYALAYDLRNLGEALTKTGDHRRARRALEKGLEYAVSAKDSNNELRARFGLANLVWEQGDVENAELHLRESLVLAERLQVNDLAWKIHRGLGLIAKHRSDPKTAEAELLRATSIARALTGRAAAAVDGLHRYSAFDDLSVLYFEQNRIEDAFRVAELAHALELTEFLDDAQIRFNSPDAPLLLKKIRQTSSSTEAAEARALLSKLEPAVERTLAPTAIEETAKALSSEQAVLFPRVTQDHLLFFVFTHQGLTARVEKVGAGELRRLVRGYLRALEARADLSAVGGALSAKLVGPIRDLLVDKTTIAIVPAPDLRNIPWMALPWGELKVDEEIEAIADHLAVVLAMNAAAGANALSRSKVTTETVAQGHIGAFAPAGVQRQASAPGLAVRSRLRFARKELEIIREEYPKAELVFGDRVTTRAMKSRLEEANGVFHFAGHGLLQEEPSAVKDAEIALAASDGSLTASELVGTRIRADMVVLSSCSPSRGVRQTRVEAPASIFTLSDALHFAGARNVLATTLDVEDFAAAMVIKRFYRAAKTRSTIEALREAQLHVRSLYPHPAWWATFAYSVSP